MKQKQEIETEVKAGEPIPARTLGEVGHHDIMMRVYVRAPLGGKLPSKKEVEDRISNLLLSSPRLSECVECRTVVVGHRVCPNCGRRSPSPNWDVSSISIPVDIDIDDSIVEQKKRTRQILEEMDEVLHPSGRCECGNEGSCGWCKETAERERIEREIENETE